MKRKEKAVRSKIYFSCSWAICFSLSANLQVHFCCMYWKVHLIIFMYLHVSLFRYIQILVVCNTMYLYVSVHWYVLVCIVYVLKNKILYLYVFAPKIMYWPNQYIQIHTYIQIHAVQTDTYDIERYCADTYKYS